MISPTLLFLRMIYIPLQPRLLSTPLSLARALSSCGHWPSTIKCTMVTHGARWPYKKISAHVKFYEFSWSCQNGELFFSTAQRSCRCDENEAMQGSCHTQCTGRSGRHTRYSARAMSPLPIDCAGSAALNPTPLACCAATVDVNVECQPWCRGSNSALDGTLPVYTSA